MLDELTRDIFRDVPKGQWIETPLACTFFIPDYLYYMVKNRNAIGKPKWNRPRSKRKIKRIYKQKICCAPVGQFLKDHKDCYLIEAKAILENKHWKGKNKCVKLIGD